MNSTDLETRGIESRSQTFAALSDPIRLRILDLLSADQQCVCDLQEAIEIAPNLLSYHLRVLRGAGLVAATRRGRWIDYQLSSDSARSVTDALPAAFRGVL
jgi:ArsR family transcriptional regulator